MSVGVSQRIKDTDKPTPTRAVSKKQEISVAQSVGGFRTPNSGATDWAKGDVCTDKWLIECKTKMTNSNSISIKKEWIEKNTQESVFMGKPYSSIAFSFGPNEPNYYIIDEYLFQDLMEYLNTKEEI